MCDYSDYRSAIAAFFDIEMTVGPNSCTKPAPLLARDPAQDCRGSAAFFLAPGGKDPA